MAVPCNQRFFLDYNDYWNRSGAGPQFVTTMPGSSVQSGSANLALSDWQGMGEDTHSINMDPKFPNPTLPGTANTGFAFLLATSGSSTLTFPYASPALNLGFCGIPGQQTGTCPSFFYPPQAGWFSSNQQTYTWIQYPTVQMISPPPIPAGSPTIPAAFPTETPPQY
jgi:hypothetical protein